MKISFFLVGVIAGIICFFSCNQEDNPLVIEIELPNGDSLRVPVGYTHEPLQGIDTYAGEIYSENKDVYLMYDIGWLAGYYVDENSPGKIIDFSVNEVFWYEKVSKQYLDDPACCVFITFPNRGPANFVTLNNDKFPEVLNIIKTYKSN